MIELRDLRRQCRIDFDDEETDRKLLNLQEQAESYIVRRTGRDAEELSTMGNGGWPKALELAVLVFVADMYAHPEGRDKPNLVLEDLIRPYQRLV